MQKEIATLYFVTRNKHKFDEISRKFQNENVKFALQQLELETIEIQANTIKDIALFKLNSVKEKINSSFFIEDAGFFVDKPLNGFPGVFSSYVFKTLGNEGILRLIDDFKKSKAHFSAVIALFFKPANEIYVFEGHVEGRVSDKIRGKGGFGFDPIFIPDIIPNKTFSELKTEEKNEISHRGQALKKLISFLKNF
ncbi:MAG: RdgB/HAM1 family non-canonical purine NTP pyrophosphatase [Candidatus Hodarchaeota archaeon]